MKYLNFKKQLIWGAIIIVGVIGVASNSQADETTEPVKPIDVETISSTDNSSDTTSTITFTSDNIVTSSSEAPSENNNNAITIDTIDFAGRTWNVRGGTGLPGITDAGVTNNWGNTSQDVFLEGNALHLRVSQHQDDQKWYSSEVYLPNSLGYGKYTFEINTRLDLLDHNLVAAPFLYQDDGHELDIEHSYWADETGNDNLFYVVQPGSKDGNKQVSSIALSDGIFEDIIDWQPDKIIFSTTQNGNTISSWIYTTSTDGSTNNFDPANALVDINFWQYRGLVPTNNITNELVINNFTFEPYVAPGADAESSTPSTTSSHLILRYNDTVIIDKYFDLTTSTYHDVINNIDYPLNGTSTVFSLLLNADEQNDSFYISDAQFDSWNNGFYVKCINLTIVTSTEDKCNNWQYTVNGAYPNVGMDKTELTGGENVYIYFGDRYNLGTEKTIFNVGETATATLKEYSYSTNEWLLKSNQLLLATEPILPDYSNWPPAIINTATTTDGLALFNFNTTGTYYLTLPDSYWPGVTIFVTSTATSTESTTSTSGGSGSTPTSNQSVSGSTIESAVTKLISFIKTNQSSDGKIIDAGTSDWLAITFAAKNIYTSDVKNSSSSLYDYLYNYDITLLNSELNSCAAYPRHILGLLASSVTKNDSKITALKTKLDACVQNNNFGQAGINDDVFGLIAAIAIGEDQNSPVVQTTLSAIKANQEADGGFAYPGPFESPDLTGAAINALKYAQTNGATVDANIFTKAKQYLKTQQLADGGWGYLNSDALTTSWAVMGINALGEAQSDWFNSAGKNPWYVLTTLKDDHFIQSWDSNTDWFGTKSAVPALLGKSWPITLDPKPVTTGSGGSSETIVIPTSTATTTVATTTITTTVATTTLSTTTVATTTEIAVEAPEIKPEILAVKPTVKLAVTSPASTDDSNSSPNKTTSEETEEQLTSGEKIEDKSSPIDNLPLDTPTRRAAKKVLAVTGGSAAALGLYLGLRLVKNVL